MIGGHIGDTLSGVKFLGEDFFFFSIPRLTSANWQVSPLHRASGYSLLKGVRTEKEGSNDISPGKTSCGENGFTPCGSSPLASDSRILAASESVIFHFFA
jgi:hypothetical protein